MKNGGVAQSYLDPLAVRIQSIRFGNRGRGWRRFLVFAELTKSKKGADYVALFTYFSFEGVDLYLDILMNANNSQLGYVLCLPKDLDKSLMLLPYIPL